MKKTKIRHNCIKLQKNIFPIIIKPLLLKVVTELKMN